MVLVLVDNKLAQGLEVKKIEAFFRHIKKNETSLPPFTKFYENLSKAKTELKKGILTKKKARKIFPTKN